MVEVRRREHETIGSLLRRFTRRVQQSGILLNARKYRFRKGKLTRREVRERALLSPERDRLHDKQWASRKSRSGVGLCVASRARTIRESKG